MGRLIMLLSGWVSAVVFIVLYLGGSKKYKVEAEAVDQEKFLLPDIFVVGMSVIRTFNINTARKSAKKRQMLSELFGRDYMSFYSMIMTAASISYVLLLLPIAFFLGALANSPILVILFAAIAALLIWFTSSKLDTALTEQHEEILLDYPNVLSNLALLVNAGMMLRDAWRTVGESGTRKLYREMQNVTKK